MDPTRQIHVLSHRVLVELSKYTSVAWSLTKRESALEVQPDFSHSLLICFLCPRYNSWKWYLQLAHILTA